MTSFVDLIDVLILMKGSRFHKDWNAELIHEGILGPMAYGKYKVLRNTEGDAVAFFTWAMPTEKELNDYYRNMDLPNSAYKSEGKDVWIIDFISKKGYTLKSVRFVKKYFCDRNINMIKWFRVEHMRIGWIKSKRNNNG